MFKAQNSRNKNDSKGKIFMINLISIWYFCENIRNVNIDILIHRKTNTDLKCITIDRGWAKIFILINVVCMGSNLMWRLVLVMVQRLDKWKILIQIL